jgi:tetratricopeptide (TPR) repeat protein
LVALGVALGAALLSVVGVAVAAVGAIVRLLIVAKRTRLEKKREAAALARRLRVPIGPVREIDPTLVGVERAEQTILPGAFLPDYVQRAVDSQLQQAVADALEGSGPWVVVVHGPSKVGKSRSLFEALRRSSSSDTISFVAPVDAAALKSLLEPGEGLLEEDCTRAVLWLDDLEPHLNGGVTWQTLREWRAGGSGRIVTATYGGKGNEVIAGSQTTGLASAAFEVLQNAREVPLAATTAEELASLSPELDPSEAAALDRHGLAAYLVAGPALERKLNTGVHKPGDEPCMEGVALVYAAVDWARCGRTDPIPESVLRALWASYLPASVPVSDEGFERALAWALAPIVGSIALLQHAGSYEPFDYVVRLVRDKPGSALVRDECWTAAVGTANDAQALAVGETAYFDGRHDVALGALARAWDSSVPEVAATAGYNRGVVLRELGRSETALEAYDKVVERFGDVSALDVRIAVVAALFNKGAELGALDRSEAAIESYDELLSRYGGAPEPELREQVASALVNRGARLSDLGRSDEAIASYDRVVALFGANPDPTFREHVARALVNKGARLGDLDRGEALEAYEEVIRRFGDDRDPAVREQVAKALFNKGATLGELDRSEEAIEVYDSIVARFGADPQPAVRERVGRALFNKGARLGKLDRRDEAIDAYEDVITRFLDAPEPALQQQVARAFVNMGRALGNAGDPGAAIRTYEEIAARFDEVDDPAIQEHVTAGLFFKAARLAEEGRAEEAISAYSGVIARSGAGPEALFPIALFNKAVLLHELDRSEAAIETYDELVAKYGDSPEAREQVASALINKGVTHAELGHSDVAIDTYDELVTRFGGAHEPSLRVRVAKALVNKAARLGVLDRPEAASEASDEVVARFGDDREPSVRRQVALALFNKASSLVELDRLEAALEAYDEVVVRLDDSNDPAELQHYLGNALFNKGVALNELNRSAAALEAFDDLIRRFAPSRDSDLQDLVARARDARQVVGGK